MTASDKTVSLEKLIEQWRNNQRKPEEIHSDDIEEREDRLREQVAALVITGLATDEAFMVVLKRMGDLDTLAQQFGKGQSGHDRKRHNITTPESGETRTKAQTETVIAIGLAAAAAVAIKLPALFGIRIDHDAGFYARNASLFVLPFLTAYFVWKRRLDSGIIRWLIAAFILAVVFANVYPFATVSSTRWLTAIHLPIALWLAVGIAYAGGRWNAVEGRMDFIRFSGELFIYYVLIALGGGVLTGFMALIFKSIGINMQPFFHLWLLPCGAAGAVLVASWLVEARQSVIENIAPMLTRIFSPLFAAMLITFLGALLFTGHGIDIGRNVLIVFDLLLVVVLGLLLYAISARDPQSDPGVFDIVQVVLVVSALLADLVALWAIGARISEFGFSPNRVAALGENVILMVNLAWSAVLYIRFFRGGGSYQSLEKWQTDYLPVYVIWAVIVVIAFPPIFGYI